MGRGYARGRLSRAPEDMVRLCLNMIVKNEAAIIDRCLVSVAPHVDYYVVCDTGSTDDTVQRVRAVFERFGVAGEVHSVPFHDFSQARNAALDRARASSAAFDYLLLADADMHLRVNDVEFRRLLRADAYLVRQESGLSYYNTRLLRRDASARYVGATHEYLAIEGETHRFDGIWFVDHADGANRASKIDRDLALLRGEIDRDPGNARAMFYLAQTLKDGGQLPEAIAWYERRIAAGGWDEEVWYARYMIALCHHQQGHTAEFVSHALAAYQQRPSRAEPLVRLARHFRETGDFETAMLFAEAAAGIAYPDDRLFVERSAYGDALDHEISVSGYYCASPRRVEAGRAACFRLAVARGADRARRDRARSNARFYVQPADSLFPSFAASPLEPVLPEHWYAMNPSVAVIDGEIECCIRTVNYRVHPDGSYDVADPEGVVRTVNYLATLDDDLAIRTMTPLDDSAARPLCFPSPVDGLEDGRLCWFDGSRVVLATSRGHFPESLNRMVLARVDTDGVIREIVPLESPDPERAQKNWMPVAREAHLLFVYGCDPTTILRFDPRSGRVTTAAISRPSPDLTHLRGGSQLVPFEAGWLAVTHEVSLGDDGRRTYLHRFAAFDRDLRIIAITAPYYLREPGYEFCAGLAIHPKSGRFLMSFGVGDREAWIARLDQGDVTAQLSG